MLAEVDSMAIRKVLNLGKRNLILLLLWKKKLSNAMRKRLLPKTEKCKNFMVKKLSMLAKEMMEISWLQELIGEIPIKLTLIKEIRRMLLLWMVLRLIEKLERLSNCILTLLLTLMKIPQTQDLINSIKIKKEYLWLLTQGGMLKVVMLNQLMLTNLMHMEWDSSN